MKRKEFKIAIIRNSTSYLSINHYNLQELGLAVSLTKLNLKVDVYYANNKNKDEQIIYKSKVKVFYMKFKQLMGQNGIFVNLFKSLKLNNYSIVQVSEESSIQSVIVGIWCKLNNIPLILWQGMYEDHQKKYKLIQIIYNFLLLPILRKCTTIVICKTELAKVYIHHKGFKNTQVIPVGFDCTKLHSNLDRQVPEALKNIDKSKDIILFVGKLIDVKNPSFVLELAKNYVDNDNIQFIMVGKGKYKDLVLRTIEDKSVNLTYIPQLNQDELGHLYSMSKVFLMPSGAEIYGMVYLECMSFGLPVISLSNAGVDSILNNGKDGFIMDELILSEWIEKIDFLLSEDLEYKKMQQNLKSRTSEFIWSNLGTKYFEVYSSVVKEQP